MKPKKEEELLARREALTAIGGIAPLFLLGCSSTDTSAAAGTTATSTTTTEGSKGESSLVNGGECVEIPDETGGSHPDVEERISTTSIPNRQ